MSGETLSFLNTEWTMFLFLIISSSIFVAASAILEEKHIVFEDPIYGPYDRLWVSQTSDMWHPDPSDCIFSTYQVVTPVTEPGPWYSTSMGSRWRRRSRGSTPGGTSSPRRRTSSPCSRRGSRTRPHSLGMQKYLISDFSVPLTPQVLEHQWRLRYLWRCLWQRQVTGRRRWG